MSKSSPSAADRAVPVRVERGVQHRIMGATDWWFYPLIIAAALVLVALSFGIEDWSAAAAPQHAARQGAALTYGPHELARGTRLDADHVRYIVRDYGVSARAVRIAVKPGRPAPAPGDTGVQLLLDPAETAGLAGKPVRVELEVRRFTITAAGGIALSLQNGGPATWVAKPMPTGNAVLVVDLPALAGAPPTALGLRMLSDKTDFNYGTEIARVTLKPAE